MFKPALDNFRAAFRNHLPDFRDFMRLEPAIEDQREIVQPDFTFVAGLEDMNMHPLGQTVAVKTDPVAVLNENRGHDETELVVASRANQTKISASLFLHPAAETFRADDGAFVEAPHDDFMLVTGFDLERDLAVFDGNHLRAARPGMIQAKIKP